MAGEPIQYRRADHGAKILVVDDDALSRRSLSAMLERSHYQVDLADGGVEGLARLDAYQPDLVLLDIQMPDLDGLEVCRRIRERPNGNLLPVIFLTADERSDIHSQAFKVGGDDFLRKPVLPAELVVRIRSLMRLKRLQAEVQAERDSLLDLQHQREQLFQFIVHDLKNPLSAIQAGLQLLQEQGGLPQGTDGQVDRLLGTAQGMGRMIQDILDIGRAEELGLDLKRARLPLEDWIPGVLREVEGPARARRHHFAVECPAGVAVHADPDYLRRLLLNLLDNAVKYSPTGARTRLVVVPCGASLRIEVQDRGHGIPEDMRERIFEKFVRLDGKGKTQRSGSGLGLAFCQLVAEAHQGRIWAEANPEGGSVFVVELPSA